MRLFAPPPLNFILFLSHWNTTVDNRAPPLEVTFIDGSPVVGDDNVTARFITNKPVASLQCRLGENVSEFKNCKDKYYNYISHACSSYTQAFS